MTSTSTRFCGRMNPETPIILSTLTAIARLPNATSALTPAPEASVPVTRERKIGSPGLHRRQDHAPLEVRRVRENALRRQALRQELWTLTISLRISMPGERLTAATATGRVSATASVRSALRWSTR